MVSKDEVRWSYRTILGREPESEDVVRRLLTATDFPTLRESFLRSPEFIRDRGTSAAAQGHTTSLPIDVPGNEIEYTASDLQLAQCLAKIKLAWSHLGIVRPHFSVLTDKQFLPEQNGKHLDKFWASGEIEAAQVERMLARYGFTDCGTKTAVEYGCGVGRVTTALARRFARVEAYDISQAHLTEARSRAQAVAAENIRFHLCADTFLDRLKPCDFFYSRIVFQHNPPPVIDQLIKRALQCLKSGGIAIFQVPTYRLGYSYSISEWLAADHPLDMQMHCIPQEAIFSIIAAEKCTLLNVREDTSTGAPDRFISNTFIIRRTRGIA
jgi:SAM-dependent methyltransferase